MAANCVCATRAAAATELLLYGGSRNRFYFTGANVLFFAFTLSKKMDVGILLPSFLSKFICLDDWVFSKSTGEITPALTTALIFSRLVGPFRATVNATAILTPV